MSIKEIGSEFDIDINIFKKNVKPWENFFPKKKMVFLSTGRDALTYLIRSYKIKNLLVPAYFEEIVLKGLKKEGVKIELYNVMKKLEIDFEDVEKKSEHNQALLIVHYFGFPQPLEKIRDLCDKKKLILIEDCVQSMLTKYNGKPLGNIGDTSFNSLRKFIGIPDGSITISKKNSEIIESKKHEIYIKKRLDALEGKFQYLKKNKKYSRFYFKQAFIKPEVEINKFSKPAPMSKISKKILIRTDFFKIVKRRRRNYNFFLTQLKEIALFPTLPSGVCPLGFPILVKNRNKVKKDLIKNKIYPPIHWELSSTVKKKFKYSGKISEHILTIPIDQRYLREDFKRVIPILKKCEKYE